MPDLSVRTAAKFWVGLIGLVFATVAASADVPTWVSLVAVVAGSVGVYLVPNQPTE
ncbi:MAG: hypothetical protein MUF56_05065 [Solirubrobacteraceae bacterium]|jgi:hypothetical protein|nr:hypothetical protein [Vicinamibacterales bacterium]MCU0258378.1 hypothetical protein [Solirubrobacteraceae bacterium]